MFEESAKDLEILHHYRHIFKILNEMYQPHNPNIPGHRGLMDSPNSLISNTKEAIQYLKQIDAKEYQNG